MKHAHLFRVSQSGKKVWKMNFFPGEGKVREFQISVREILKNYESQGKVREFENFPKNLIVNSPLKNKLQAGYGQKHHIPNIHCSRCLFKDKTNKHRYLYKIFELSIWMKMAIISHQTGSGKRLKVIVKKRNEKSYQVQAFCEERGLTPLIGLIW